jgi:hypothetical protein
MNQETGQEWSRTRSAHVSEGDDRVGISDVASGAGLTRMTAFRGSLRQLMMQADQAFGQVNRAWEQMDNTSACSPECAFLAIDWLREHSDGGPIERVPVLRVFDHTWACAFLPHDHGPDVSGATIIVGECKRGCRKIIVAGSWIEGRVLGRGCRFIPMKWGPERIGQEPTAVDTVRISDAFVLDRVHRVFGE